MSAPGDVLICPRLGSVARFARAFGARALMGKARAMTIRIGAGEDWVALSEELESIVLRASRLGLSRHRVAIALRISPEDLAQIEHRYGLAPAARC